MPRSKTKTGIVPISAILVTHNEEARIESCLKTLSNFDDIWVVDSNSQDQTTAIARKHNANIVNFTWNGQYPKKRQWCLDTLALKHDWVFFVDADEHITPDLITEITDIATRDQTIAGYFIHGQYLWKGAQLRHGLMNNKLALFNRHKMHFPTINDLDLPGIGEIEGHYQPVLKPDFAHETIGQLQSPLIHDAGNHWEERHLRYAAWEAGMNARNAWPSDPSKFRRILKTIFKTLPCRPLCAFLHSYILKAGFLDGRAGFDFAQSRARYYTMINHASRALKTNKPQEETSAIANSKPART